MSSKPNNHSKQNSHKSKQLPATNPSSGVPFGYLPAYLPGSSSLVEQLDRRLLIVLRDGRHLIGVLRSFDQFSNCMLEDTQERRILKLSSHKTVFVDIPLGLFLLRGDSIVLLGEIDSGRTTETEEEEVEGGVTGGPKMERVSKEEFERLRLETEEEYEKGLLTWDFDTDLVV